MCGIFAYGGATGAAERIINGLRRLEYRGYDSWGVAVITDGVIRCQREVGAVGCIGDRESFARACIGLGHTRWATHGGVSQANAHPHLSTGGDFAIVHNGIVENYQDLKRALWRAGHVFETDTDTEVIVRLIEDKLRKLYDGDRSLWMPHPLRIAVMQAFRELVGRNTVLVLATEDDCLIGVRNGSPLVVGYADNEIYIASDPLSFANQTRQVRFIEDMQLVEYRAERVAFFDAISGDSVNPETTQLGFDDTEVGLHDYPHYMLKEVLEQPQAIANAGLIREAELQALGKAIGLQTRVITVGAGGAFYAAEQIAYFLSAVAGVDAHSVAAYEMDASAGLIHSGDVLIAVSQSGETADTIDAMCVAQSRGARIASIVNMPGSTLSRMSEFAFYSRSGPEVCVLSTKSSAAQMTFGYMLAHYLCGRYAAGREQLEVLRKALQLYLDEALLLHVRGIAETIMRAEHLFILGKGAFRVSARIGALNIKEASYIHAEGFAAGELKHGVIALIAAGVPVVVFVDEHNREAMLNATAEVKSRGAYVIGVAQSGNELFDVHIPLVAIAGPVQTIGSLIPCQLLAYYLSTLNDRNPDRPRNLAKSVTVR